ncbi:MAG: hypothetical protein ABSF22_03035 [Bryobacteraceae bacterium]|jgi:hypothetical protein
MPCLLLLLTLAFPRVVMVVMFFLSDYLQRAYSAAVGKTNALIAIIIGFIFLPLTTIVYAWIVNSHQTVQGVYLVAIIVSVLIDLGLLGHGARSRRSD